MLAALVRGSGSFLILLSRPLPCRRAIMGGCGCGGARWRGRTPRLAAKQRAGRCRPTSQPGLAGRGRACPRMHASMHVHVRLGDGPGWRTYQQQAPSSRRCREELARVQGRVPTTTSQPQESGSPSSSLGGPRAGRSPEVTATCLPVPREEGGGAKRSMRRHSTADGGVDDRDEVVRSWPRRPRHGAACLRTPSAWRARKWTTSGASARSRSCPPVLPPSRLVSLSQSQPGDLVCALVHGTTSKKAWVTLRERRSTTLTRTYCAVPLG